MNLATVVSAPRASAVDKQVRVDHTKTQTHRNGVARINMLAKADPRDRLGVVLGMRLWKGSSFEESTSEGGEVVYNIRHPSGARMRLVAEVRQ